MALFLQKYCPHIRVDIYESTHELTEIGAGIGMFPRVWEILKTLDIEEDLLTIIGNADASCQWSHPFIHYDFLRVLVDVSNPYALLQVRRTQEDRSS